MPNARESLAVWIGTRKGAFVFRSKDRKQWKVEGPHFRGFEVNHVAQDHRDPKRFYAAISAAGAFRSFDAGATWEAYNQGSCKKKSLVFAGGARRSSGWP
jgi:hypothetical protein